RQEDEHGDLAPARHTGARRAGGAEGHVGQLSIRGSGSRIAVLTTEAAAAHGAQEHAAGASETARIRKSRKPDGRARRHALASFECRDDKDCGCLNTDSSSSRVLGGGSGISTTAAVAA